MEGPSEAASILLVDDRTDKLLALETMLLDLKQNLVKVRSGDEALRQLLLRDFAVILLDVNMPGLDGFETAALIRNRPRSEATPIIFISAINDTENHVSRGYSLGAVDYILSPVVPEILRAKVSAFVDLFLKTEQIKRQAHEHTRLIRELAARAQAEAARERMEFLAEASNVLGGSLEYDQTFDSLALLIVPRLAGFCIIGHIEEDGSFHQVAAAHQDPGQMHLLHRIRDAEPLGISPEALRDFRNGIPYFCNQVDERAILDRIPRADRELIRLLAPSSFAAIPVVSRSRIIGAILMVHTMPGRIFGQDEIWLAEELARRTALALDNVELYRRANQAREDAEAANHEKDRFLAMLSHELRTPLTPVIAHLAKLESDDSVPAALRHPLAVIRRNVELEARLIDDLLDLTRVGNGKFHLEKKVVDVHTLLENALEICRGDIEAKRLGLHPRFGASASHVLADPARLQQVFWNILKNAVKFTTEGTIEVSTEDGPGRDRVQIAIRDTGLGMDAELISRAFEAFEQGDSGKHGGLGLGLAITKALVDLHAGEISVESPGPGRGTLVRITLPTVEEVPVPAVESLPTPLGGVNGGIRILLVEDHVDTNHSLTMLLELQGYSVTSAFNVKTAVEIARREDFDLLISDLGLPDGSAGEVMEQVAARNAAVGVALSGLGMEKDVEMSRSFGFTYHLVKPVDVDRLDEVIRQSAGG